MRVTPRRAKESPTIHVYKKKVSLQLYFDVPLKVDLWRWFEMEEQEAHFHGVMRP